jgi:short-subunit dehydrogenase
VLSLRYEVEPFGIQVALVEPAQVSTTFAQKIHRLPPEGSPYRERVRRFIERDRELIRNAPDPQNAARRIVALIESERMRTHNQVDPMSTVFLFLNRILPEAVRDRILLHHMRIRV